MSSGKRVEIEALFYFGYDYMGKYIEKIFVQGSYSLHLTAGACKTQTQLSYIPSPRVSDCTVRLVMSRRLYIKPPFKTTKS